MAELAAYLGTGGAVVFAAVAVWLALRLVKAERERSGALISLGAIDADRLEALHARDTAEAATDAARAARDEAQRRLDHSRSENRRLFDALRKARAGGAGDMFDDLVDGMHPNKDGDGGADGAGSSGDAEPVPDRG